ncbi:MAG: Eco57I restriction-modification methylase domain-containing protein [Candidatus Hodarchaeales archaeon]
MQQFLIDYEQALDDLAIMLSENSNTLDLEIRENVKISIKRQMILKFLETTANSLDAAKLSETSFNEDLGAWQVQKADLGRSSSDFQNFFDEILPYPFPHRNADFLDQRHIQQHIDSFLTKYEWTLAINDRPKPEILNPAIFEMIYNLEKGRETPGVVSTPAVVSRVIVSEAFHLHLSLDILKSDVKDTGVFSAKNTTSNERIVNALRALKVLDIAAGCGSFYLESVSLLANLLYHYSVSDFSLKEAYLYTISSCLYGVDIDRDAITTARIKLILMVASETKIVNPDFLIRISRQCNLKVGNALIGFISKPKANQKSLQPYLLSSRDSDQNEAYPTTAAFREFILANNFDLDYVESQLPFHWHEEFPDVMNRGGFDLVLGNPPYIGYGSIDKRLKALLKACFPDIYSGLNDLMYFFVARSLELARSGEGNIALLISRYFLEARFSAKLRKFVTQKAWIRHIVDLREQKLFEFTSNNVAFLFMHRRDKINSSELTQYSRLNTTKATIEETMKYIERGVKVGSSNLFTSFLIERNHLEEERWLLVPSQIVSIIRRLREESIPLGELCNIGTGYHTGRDKIFAKPIQRAGDDFIACVEETENNPMVYPLETALVKETIKTTDILPFAISWAPKYVLLVDRDIDINSFPKTKEYLSVFKDELRQRYECQKNQAKWYELAQVRNRALFSRAQKIVCPYRTTIPRFAIDERKRYHSIDCTMLAPKEENGARIFLLLGILNSELIEFYLRLTVKKLDARKLELYPRDLSEIPIRISKEKPLVEKANEIAILAKGLKEQLSTEKLDKNWRRNALNFARSTQDDGKKSQIILMIQQLDKMVYGLYGLTDSEVRAIKHVLHDLRQV